jgi:hypothetical protein
MKRAFILTGILLVIIFLAFYFILLPKTPILSGYAARMACTCHFVQYRNLEEIKIQDLGFSFFQYVDISIDDKRKVVKASTFGLSPRTAAYKKGKGCILIKGEDDFNVTFAQPEIIDTFKWDTSPKLSLDQRRQIDDLLYDEEGEFTKKTRACLIIHKDSIIYESYAKGFDKNTPQLGWSMTKSVTGALIGQMIKDKYLAIDQSKLFPSWSGPKSNITVADLLHMKSGIAWEEDYSTVSPATQMLFNCDDIVDYNLGLGIEAPSGSHFEYSSGTTNTLFGLIRKTLNDSKTYYEYPYEKLFKPLGMSSAFIEMDESGNYIGSSYMWATPRDWAKFGLLYLHQGNWHGHQVLDSSWVDYTFASDDTSLGEYGTQFWHNDGLELPNIPKDVIYADGFQGQRIFIFPSHDLVIVRLGLSKIDFDNLNAMVLTMLK